MEMVKLTESLNTVYVVSESHVVVVPKLVVILAS
jgi:hypothetical protein